MFESVLREFSGATCIIIHRHKNPDGDAIGSQTGLKYLLKSVYPDKEVYAVGDSPARYGFIEGSAPDDVPDERYRDALSVVLDTSARTLISDDRYATAARSVRIDHHNFTEKICDVEVTDTSFESCCGLVTAMAMEAGWDIPLPAAKALYTGLVTDSGRFRYGDTSSRTFELAAQLLKKPFSLNEIYSHLYADDFSRVLLRARYVLKIRFTEHGVAYIYTDRQELQESGADVFAVSRGMVGTMSDIRNVDIWVNFTESDNGVLCELRSNRYNINPIAVKYGGGGHDMASGATVKDRETAMRMLHDLDHMYEELTGGQA